MVTTELFQHAEYITLSCAGQLAKLPGSWIIATSANQEPDRIVPFLFTIPQMADALSALRIAIEIAEVFPPVVLFAVGVYSRLARYMLEPP